MILVLSKMSPNCQKFSRHHLCMAGDYLAQPCTASLQRSENCSGSLVLGPEISLELHLHEYEGKKLCCPACSRLESAIFFTSYSRN